MPILHPNHPRIPPNLFSEQEVLRALRTLPPEAHIFTRLCILDPERNEEREIDFLVAHPELGLVVIEVKGKGVQPAGDHWVRSQPDGTTQILKETPGEQLQAQQWALFRHLKQRLSGPVPQITRVLALPLLPIPDERSLGPELPACRILNQTKLNHLFVSLRHSVAGDTPWSAWKASSEGRHHQISAGLLQQVVEALTPGLMPLIPLAEVISAEGRLQDEGSRQLIDHLSLNFSRGRFRVQGGPGSGKSLIARQTARIWASEGRRVLFLAYNKAITYATQCALDDLIQSGAALVSTYHDLAVNLLSSANCLPDNSDLSRFFGQDVPNSLADLISNPASIPSERWDALIVDEAQDLDPSWISPLLNLLHRPEEDPVLLLEDPAQSIYRTTRHVLGQPWTLDLSLRQHPVIRRAAYQAYPECGWEAPEVPDPDGVVRRIASEPNAWRRQLGDILEELYQEGIKADQIMILSHHRPITLGIKDGDCIGPWRVNPVPDWWEGERADQVRFGTVQGFKGLESDVVIYLAPARPGPEDYRLSYIAISRARQRLIILERAIPDFRRIPLIPEPITLTVKQPTRISVPRVQPFNDEQRQVLIKALTVVKPLNPSKPNSKVVFNVSKNQDHNVLSSARHNKLH